MLGIGAGGVVVSDGGVGVVWYFWFTVVVVFVVVLPFFDGVSLQWWVGFCCLVVVFWGV